MRYGLLADIHGNLEALEGAVAFLDAEGVDSLICLGDIIGYNANPSECVAIVRDRFDAAIQGNHERMALGGSMAGLRDETVQATHWTIDQLSEDDVAYLKGLPDEVAVGDHILIVHGSPRDPDEYILSTDAIRANSEVLREKHPTIRMCFFGHSHFPMAIRMPEIHTLFHETRTVDIDTNRLYLINPGSVGQPRDGSPLSSFAIYDDEAGTVTIYRQPYDIAATQAKILKAGLSERLAERLAKGK